MTVCQEVLGIDSHGFMNNIENVLRKLVSIRSYIPYENESFEFLIAFLKERNFKVKKQFVEHDRYNLLAERGKGEKSILFYVHLDTVPPAKGYSFSPLTLQKKGKRFLGLGCFDMKGGIAVLLSIINATEFKNLRIKLAFCIDEEGMSRGVYKLVSSPFIKDVVVAFCPEACIVPSKWKLPIMLVIGGRGRCVIEINVPGKTVHGAEDHGGINAIDQAAILICNLKRLKQDKDSQMGESSFFVKYIHADNSGLSIPDSIVLEIDYQLVFGQTPQAVEASFKRFLSKLYNKKILEYGLQKKCIVKLKQRETPYISPYKLPENNRYVKLVEEVVRDSLGGSDFDYTRSVADQNVLANAGISTITIGPIGGKAHQVGEWVSISSLNTLASLYKDLLSKIVHQKVID
jgi:succinyl-diaminopimelate desuccinylase